MEKQNPLFDISRERGIYESFRIPKIFKNHIYAFLSYLEKIALLTSFIVVKGNIGILH